MRPVVLDTGPLIAVDRGDRLLRIVVEETLDLGHPIVVPAGCVAQAVRRPPRQVRLTTLLRIRGVTVAPLDDSTARRIGALLEHSGTSDVIDGHVALLALDLDALVFTSDPHDIALLAPDVAIQPI